MDRDQQREALFDILEGEARAHENDVEGAHRYIRASAMIDSSP
jgi:hypothetical protein